MASTTTTPKTFPDATETFKDIERASEKFCDIHGRRLRDPSYFYPHVYGALKTDYKHLLAAYNALAAENDALRAELDDRDDD